jgi:hypothetical protein
MMNTYLSRDGGLTWKEIIRGFVLCLCIIISLNFQIGAPFTSLEITEAFWCLLEMTLNQILSSKLFSKI